MALLTVEQIGLAGLTAPTPVAAAAAGDTFPNNGRTFLLLYNAGVADIAVTVNSLTDCNQGHDHDILVSAVVPTGDTVLATTPMVNGDYAITAQPAMPRRLIVTRHQNDALDTGGTVTIHGLDQAGNAVSEAVAVGGDGVLVYTDTIFGAVTQITQTGWSIDGGGGVADDIEIGEDGNETLVGPFPMNRFNDSDGIVGVTYSTHVDLSIAAVSL